MGLLESVLFEKLLLHNARLDSLEVTEAEVMGEIDRRLAYYMQMLGSLEAFEAEYGKPVAEWKAEFNDPVASRFCPNASQIDQSVRSTPAQVQAYFDAIPVTACRSSPRNSATANWSCSPKSGKRRRCAPEHP